MSGNADNLVRMANQIGEFFGTLQDRALAREEIARHLKRFWEPRMRRALLAHVDACAGAGSSSGLSEIVSASVKAHRHDIL